MTASQDITQIGGVITVTNANLKATQNITQTAGSIVAANTTAEAGNTLSLARITNKLQNVSVKAENGSVTIVSGNDEAGALNVQTVGTVGGALAITNKANGTKNIIKVNKNLKASGAVSITNEEAAINVEQGATMEGSSVSLTSRTDGVAIDGGAIAAKNGNVSMDAAKGIALNDGTIAATSGNVIMKAAEAVNMKEGTITTNVVDVNAPQLNVNGGTIYATRVEADHIMTLAGGTVNATNIVTNENLTISGSTVNTGDGTGMLKATNISLTGGQVNGANVTNEADENYAQSGGVIAANTATVKAGQGINLTSGKVQVTTANLTATNGSISEAADFALESPVLNASAAGDITLASRANQLEQVNIVRAGNDVTIGSANSKNSNALQIEMNVPIIGNLTVTNYNDNSGYSNVIEVPAQLQAGGTITLINEETAIIVDNDASINAKNVVLNAVEITVNGTVDTTNGTTTLTSAGDLTLSGGGTVSGNVVDVNAGNNFIHNGGLIDTADAVIKAQRNILLQGGSLHANNADLFAVGGYVDESYNNSANATAADSYDFQVTTLLRAASGSAANNSVGIDLGSRFNKLAQVQVATAAGDVLLGNGNTGTAALDVTIMNKEQPIAGNISIINYQDSDNYSNAVTVVGLLQANGNVEIINQEGNVEVLNATGATIKGKNVSLQAAGDIINNNTIIAAAEAELLATNNVFNRGSINATTVNMQANTSDVVLYAGDIVANSVTMSAKRDVLLQNGSLLAGTASLIATNGKLLQVLDANGHGHELAVDNLTVKAGNGVDLASHDNKLANIYLDASGTGVNIGNANTGNTALKIYVKDGNTLSEDIVITNYNNLAEGELGNDIVIDGNLLTTGKLTLQNEESNIHNQGNVAGSEVLMDAVGNVAQAGGDITSSKVTLTAGRNVSVVDGDIKADGGQAYLQADHDVNISGGSVRATGGTIDIVAKNDVTQSKGSMLLDNGHINIRATNDIILENGLMQAQNALLVAEKGHISENYNNALTTFNGYALNVSDRLIVAAGNKSNNASAINLGSRFNELQDVVLKASKGDILVGSGRSIAGDLSISVATNEVVDGNIEFHNYANGTANKIFLKDTLKATGDIKIINDEATPDSEATGIIDTISIQVGNNLPSVSVEAGKNIILQANAGSILNTGSMKAQSISLRAEQGSVLNAQPADMQTTNGNIEMYAFRAIGNAGELQAEQGNISLHTVNGMLYNDANATMMSKGGDIELLSANNNVTNNSGANLVSVGGTVTLHADAGNVENAGDLVALGGQIVLQSDQGNVTNSDNFNTVYSNGTQSDKFDGKDITTGSITMSAVNGTLINNVDLEAGKDVTLIAKEGLTNFAYKVFAGKDISLTATAGDLVNTSTLESVKGNITLTAEHGNVVNGTSETNRAGDIITLGGTVTLKAKGTGNNVTNFGDIIAVDKFGSDNANAGSIVLQSAYGNVYNYDDFNTYSKNEDVNSNYLLTLAKTNHKSAGLVDETVSYNLATSNITLSAVHGEIVNSKNYLVALGNVTMKAQDGIGSLGQVILAGGTISLEDTDGNLLNKAKLISVNGNVELTAKRGFVVNEAEGDVFALNGNVTLHANGEAGDVINKGDLVALNENNVAGKGGIELISASGDVYNYDEFKDVDGRNSITFYGESGYASNNGVAKFNPTTPYAEDRSYILTDADLLMSAENGSLYNTMDMNVAGDITLISGNDLVVGVNVKSINAGGSVALESKQGSVNMDNSSVTSGGSVAISGEQGVSIKNNGSVTSAAEMVLQSASGSVALVDNSQAVANSDLIVVAQQNATATNSKLESINGSLSAVAVYGDVNVGELAAADMVAAGSGAGDVIIGTVESKNVVVYTEGIGKKLKADSIKVEQALVLQGDNIYATNVDRSANNGQLLVDITGSAGGAMKGELKLAVDGDVRFTTTSVTDATITIDGAASFDKLHTEGALHIISPGMVTGVYGRAPYHDTSNYLYYDLGGINSSSSGHEQIKDEYFTVAKALESMSKIQERIDNAANKGQASGNNGGSMYLYIDSPTYQRSNGILLHIDTGYRAADQRWSAEDLSGKLADFKSHDAFVAHYGDVAGNFGRYDLVELAPRTVGQILQDVTANKVVLQSDNGQLRIENVQYEQDDKREREEHQVANE